MLALIAPNSIKPNTTLSLIKLSVRNLYSAKDQLESDSEPADLNNINTKNPVKIIGIIRKSETFSHPNPLNLINEPNATPEISPPITGGPIVALCVEGIDVIQVVRDMLGATNGRNAAPGTVRGDYSASRQMNLVHASDGPEAAEREMNLYFDPTELCPNEPTLTPWLKAADE